MDTPDRIYLQTHDELGNEMDYILDEITWCVDQINDTDVEYVHVDKYRALEEKLSGYEELIRHGCEFE